MKKATTAAARPVSHQPTPAAAKCRKASRTLLRMLEAGLTGRVVKMAVVRSPVKPDPPALGSYQRFGVYFVSAKLAGGQVVTWAVSGDAVHSGGGAIVGADAATRKVSQLGDQAPDPDQMGVGRVTVGYSESRACVS